MKNKIVIRLLALLLIITNIITAGLLLNSNEKLRTETAEKEQFKRFKDEIVDNIDKELYIVDGGTLEQGKFYRIHFKYELGNNANESWYELYIDDDFTY